MLWNEANHCKVISPASFVSCSHARIVITKLFSLPVRVWGIFGILKERREWEWKQFLCKYHFNANNTNGAKRRWFLLYLIDFECLKAWEGLSFSFCYQSVICCVLYMNVFLKENSASFAEKQSVQVMILLLDLLIRAC